MQLLYWVETQWMKGPFSPSNHIFVGSRDGCQGRTPVLVSASIPLVGVTCQPSHSLPIAL